MKNVLHPRNSILIYAVFVFMGLAAYESAAAEQLYKAGLSVSGRALLVTGIGLAVFAAGTVMYDERFNAIKKHETTVLLLGYTVLAWLGSQIYSNTGFNLFVWSWLGLLAVGLYYIFQKGEAEKNTLIVLFVLGIAFTALNYMKVGVPFINPALKTLILTPVWGLGFILTLFSLNFLIPKIDSLHSITLGVIAIAAHAPTGFRFAVLLIILSAAITGLMTRKYDMRKAALTLGIGVVVIFLLTILVTAQLSENSFVYRAGYTMGAFSKGVDMAWPDGYYNGDLWMTDDPRLMVGYGLFNYGSKTTTTLAGPFFLDHGWVELISGFLILGVMLRFLYERGKKNGSAAAAYGIALGTVITSIEIGLDLFLIGILFIAVYASIASR